MRKTLVLLIVGLTRRLLGPHTPNLNAFAERGDMRSLKTVVPAVTCTVQSTLLTGLPPSGHGAVANGWYFRQEAEIWFWRQSNRLIAGEKIWDAAKRRDPDFTCANMFWWYNMYSTVDISATPRPMYPADGRKIPDHYAEPPELRDELNQLLGSFPLFSFWGPMTTLEFEPLDCERYLPCPQDTPADAHVLLPPASRLRSAEMGTQPRRSSPGQGPPGDRRPCR